MVTLPARCFAARTITHDFTKQTERLALARGVRHALSLADTRIVASKYMGASLLSIITMTAMPAMSAPGIATHRSGIGGDGSEGFVIEGVKENDDAGWSVSDAGDVNADGIDDVIIGAGRAAPGGKVGAGASYVVFGRTSGFPASLPLASLLPAGGGDGSAGFMLAGVDPNDHSGEAVTGVGDVNGDGIDDIAIGADNSSHGRQLASGETYVVFGRSTGFPATFSLASLFPPAGGDGSAGFVLIGITDDDHSGNAISGAGDVNGDGIDDLIIGAITAGPGSQNNGQAFVVFGRATGFPAVFPLGKLMPRAGGDGSEGFAVQGYRNIDFAGSSVSGAGDVNGDGIDDVIVGAFFADPNHVGDAGEAYVIFGRRAFAPAFNLGTLAAGDGSMGFALTGVDIRDHTGYAVAAAGDINGDGIDDVLVGAPDAEGPDGSYVGDAYVIFGRPTGFPGVFPLARLLPGGNGDGSEGFVLRGIDSSDKTGESLSRAGDVNGDGVNDIIIGAGNASPDDRPAAGRSYVVFGRTSGFPPLFELATLLPTEGGDGSSGFVMDGSGRHSERSGGAVSGAGDVNGDGIDDVIIGAMKASPNNRYSAGRSYVVLGRETGFPAEFELSSLFP